VETIAEHALQSGCIPVLPVHLGLSIVTAQELQQGIHGCGVLPQAWCTLWAYHHSFMTQTLLCCFCAHRYGLNDDKCKICEIGKYGSGAATGNICWDCSQTNPGWTTLQPGATSFSDCVCDVGYGNDGCEPCGFPFYQGRLNEYGVPVTTATPGNPTPRCLKCNVEDDEDFTVVGSRDRTCVDLGGGGAGAYCAKLYNPFSIPGAAFETPLACAPRDGFRRSVAKPNVTRPGRA
jgi:hypothetical protein